MIVVDASALLEALLRTPAARVVEERLFEPQQTLHAPHLLDIEVAQVIPRYAAKGEIDDDIFHALERELDLDELSASPPERSEIIEG